MWNSGNQSLSINQVTLSGQQDEQLNPQAPPFNTYYQQAPPMHLPPPNFQAPLINPMVPHPPNIQAPQINPLRAPNQMGPFFPIHPPPFQNKQVVQPALRVQNKEVEDNNSERNTGVPAETGIFQDHGTSLNSGNNAEDNLIEDQSLAQLDSSIDSESSLYDLY